MRNLKIKNNESGRSMIEMLGVLAIIGVLSVGGIAGYSKAMQKYRINKTIEQITLIAGNVRTFFANQRNYSGLNDDSVIKKAKLVPDEMWDGNYIKDVWGNTLYMHGETPSFYINLEEISESDCIELGTQDWTNLNLAGISLGGINTDKYDFKYDGICSESTSTIFCAKDIPVAVDKVVTACSGGNKSLYFVFKK
ncbi:MAG: hypothetical protein IJ525_04535 [Alphaproteobacteria bacterium]|nr:hypothetical protein [Alphaproteobacteria bacterium]